MALTVQNLRAVGVGVEPASLLPGQIAFNITDKVLYVGDGSNFKTDFLGNQVVGVPGNGWYAMPMDFETLGDYYVANPGVYGDIPTDQQVLTWSTALNHPIWTSGAGGGGNQIYVVTNAQVAAAPGATTSAKISAAIGVASPDEGNVTIVTGLPDDVYEGLYFFLTDWVRGASYAYPSASEVIYDNTAHPSLTPTVQGAIDDLDDGLTATTAIANTANSTATSALSIANAALPKAGGTMTGTIVAQNINIQPTYGLQFNAGVGGVIEGITDSTATTSSVLAASAAGLKASYDLANAALARSGGTMTGAITFVAGQTFPVSGIQDATLAQKGVVQVGTNIQVAAGVISILDSSVSNKGVVQLYDGVNSTSPTLALTANQGSILQGQIDSLTLASNVTLAGSLDASSGLVDSITTAGAGTVPPFAAGFVLPSPQVSLADYYVLVTTAGSYSPPGGGGPYLAEPGDWILCGETFAGSGIYVWQYLGVGARPQPATYTTAGIVQLADTSVTYTGTSDTEAVTPQSLQDKLSDSTSLADSNRIASSLAVKSAYDLGFAALPKAGGTMTGNLTFSGASVGVIFNDASNLRAISDSVATTSSTTAASSTAVKSAYDLANSALQRAGGTMTGAITFAAGQTFPITGIQDATTGQKGVVQIGTNIDVASGTISVATATTAVKGVVQVGSNIDVLSGTISVKSASTTQSGIVQLNDTVASTSTTQALTANQGYNLQQQINALATSNNLTFAGTIDGSTGLMATVTVEGSAVGFNVGSILPTPSATINEYFVIASTAGTMTPPGGVPTAVYVGDWWLASSTTWTYIAAGFQPPYASTTTPGLVRLSTNAETQTGTDATEAVTPASLQSKVSDSTSTTSSTAIASSTAVKSAYDLANAAVPKSTYSALGVIVAGTGAGTIGGLTLGTNGQFLAANSACSTGLQWCTISLACVPCSAYTSVGAILAGTGAGTFTALPVGTNGQVLVPNSACTAGLEWITTSALSFVGYTCTAAPFNTAFGGNAGDSITSGACNTVIGYNAGTAITTGGTNTLVGYNAGDSLTAGSANTFIGFGAGQATTGGNDHVAIGYGAMCNYTGNTQGMVAIGLNALCSLTSGLCNTAIGYNAAAVLTTGGCNVAIGSRALDSAVGGAGNVAVGVDALTAVTSGDFNTAVGFLAADAMGTGANNVSIGYSAHGSSNPAQQVAIGKSALQSSSATGSVGVGFEAALNSSSGLVTAIGYNALRGATTGTCNTVVGYNAGCSITTGSDNVFIGHNAGDAATGLSQAVAIGSNALGSVASTTGTVAIGASALALLTTGDRNVAVGYLAGTSVTSGIGNTLIGYRAGDAISTTSNNTIIGNDAGNVLTGGGNNVFIGSGAGDTVSTGSSNTIIGNVSGSAALANNLILAAGATIKLQVNENGAVGVGPTPSYGTSGQILSSTGTAGAAAWTSSLPQVTAPTASTDAGVQGQIASDSTYFYMYTGGRWQRIAWDATVW